ncbi:MAG: hypothetical protein HY744_01405 [Deltaproteobacteria bacterium]|nr:hypothetical protein [Deltaproteobacteria bacterium]
MTNTITISEAFDLPAREDLTALGFVVRLTDAASPAVLDKLVADYVLTPKVKDELPAILGKVRTAIERRDDYGRFVHGSFGSGKSHFMTVLGLCAEDHDGAWRKVGAAVPGIEAEHRGWLRQAQLLVVRIHMLTVSRTDTGFDRAVYEGFNLALERRGKERCSFVHVDGILDEARKEGEAYQDLFWRNLEVAGVVGSRDDFEALAQGTAQEREDLARAYLEYKGRDASTAGLNPSFAEGLQTLARHAEGQGFGGVLLLVDELLLWLGEKQAHEFRQAINQLNTVVEHSDGQRAVPIVCFVARQRNIREFFPDMVQEDQLNSHIDHHSQRFEVTELRDVELRHVCRERVLKRRRRAEVEAAIASLAREHKSTLPAVLQGADVSYLEDVYPFHPALIEMLIDVSSLMQRERTALRLLYELLVVHYPDLPLGALLPVGCAFDALFPESGVEGSKRTADLKAIHQLYYVRFRPAVAAMLKEAKQAAGEFDESRRRTLEQVVKTALVAEVSPRLKSQGLTVERLVRLNDVDVATGELDRTRMSVVFEDLVDLSRKVPALQVTGKGKSAIVTITLQGVSFDEILNRARSRAEGEHARKKTFFALIRAELHLEGKKGFTDADGNDGSYETTWRRTRRKGSVSIANVRETAYADFKPRTGEEFRILVDYPWDEPGHTVEEDRQRAHKVRHSEGKVLTVCWLPRHFTSNELAVLADLSACWLIVEAPADDDLFAHLTPTDRQQVVERAGTQAVTLKTNLTERLKDVYKDSAEAVALIDGIDGRVTEREDLAQNLEEFARALLDRQYPEHPTFTLEPTPEHLRTLCDWMLEASTRPGDWVEYDAERQGKILRGVGQPFELVETGERKARLRLDTRFIKTAIEKSVEIDNRARAGLRLQRAPVLDLPEWTRLRDLAQALFDLPAPSAHRSLAEQDRVTGELREAAEDCRTRLRAVHQRVVDLVGSEAARLEETKQAIAGLAPLAKKAEPSQMLRELLALWPDDRAAPVVLAMRRLAEAVKALDALDLTSHHLLGASATAPAHGAAEKWNREAKELLRSIVEKAPRRPEPPPPPPPPPADTISVITGRVLAVHDGDALVEFMKDLRGKLQGLEHEEVEVDVAVRPRRAKP